MNDRDAIALLVAGYDDDGSETATVILRDLSGRVSMQQLQVHEPPARGRDDDTWFRRGRTIRDPVSREIVGYCLENLTTRH